MDRLATGCNRELRKQKCNSKTGDVHERHRKAAPLEAVRVCFGFWIKGTEDVTCNRRTPKQPHAKKSKPGEELHWRELPHCARHLTQSLVNLEQACQEARFLAAHAIESFHVFRRIFFG